MPWLPRLALLALCAALVLVATDRVFASGAAAATCGSTETPTATVYLPNVTKTFGGPNGWVTPIYIQNAGAVQTAVELSFMRFSDGALVACHRTENLPPGASLVDNPNEGADLPHDTQFSVVARSYGAPIVALVNQVQGAGASQQALAYTGFTQGDTTVYLPNVTRRFFGYDVPFIVQNLGTTTASVTVRFISFDGTGTFTRSFTVAPGRSYVVDPNYEPAFAGAANSGLIDGTQYAVTLTANQPIAVVANAHSEAGAPVGFSHNGIGRGARTLYAPYAAKAAPPGNTFSPVVVQNLGTTPTDAQLTFTPATVGILPQTFTLRAIPAGGAQAFDPRFTLGTTTPCDAASATCLGAGEYTLRISAANPVAAVVLPNSATTAGGYLASTELAQRVLVPTAFRRIGGPSGWNTRVVVQADTSAQVTVRAFAIPSGDLAATFQIPIGQTGWTSFDLRGVAGLADETQYAVTVDGGGRTIAAVGLERASTGGDAFMVLEAFGRTALPTELAPASISVTPAAPTLYAGWSQQLTATVRDQFGAPMPGRIVNWSVAPSAVGAVTTTGRFTAATTAGAGTLAAASGAVTTRVPITVSLPQTATLGGISFQRFAANGADVYAETTIAPSGTQTVVTQVEADLSRIRTDYARAFAGRPTIYALGSSTTFVQAVRQIGGSTSDPPKWAGGICICREPRTDWVFVNWSSSSSLSRATVVRHELTHVLQYEMTPTTVLPTWFDEGNARLEEFGASGTLWWAALQRYRAASMASLGSLYTLDELTSGLVWSLRSEVDAAYAYAVASQAVALLRADIGMSGELLIFALMERGRSFDDAFAIVAGRTLADFGAAFAGRVRALATSYPGIAAAQDSPDGPGLAFIVYGLPANASLTYRVTGTDSSVPRTVAADAYGVFYIYLASLWPPGSYTLTVTWSGGTLTATATKTQ